MKNGKAALDGYTDADCSSEKAAGTSLSAICPPTSCEPFRLLNSNTLHSLLCVTYPMITSFLKLLLYVFVITTDGISATTIHQCHHIDYMTLCV